MTAVMRPPELQRRQRHEAKHRFVDRGCKRRTTASVQFSSRPA